MLLLAVPFLAALAIACGSDSEADGEATPTPTPVATELPDDAAPELDTADRPPTLTVRAGDASVDAALGTFCWAGLCADAFAPITPAQPFVVQAGELVGTLDAEAIEEVSTTAWPASSSQSQVICTASDGEEAPGGPICAEGEQLLGWPGVSGESVALTSTADGASVALDISTLEPDTYVVSIFVRFASGGDASYGVLLEVGS
ncbi:MAG: hypothetical protein WD939_09620 [Dehalococcoidia bacterium]